MLAGRLPGAFVMLAVLVGGHAAHAHGIAGNRFFPGTLAFDDPAVADEAIVPLYSTFKHPAEIGDGQVADNAFNLSLFRLLTPTLGVGVDSGWAHRNWGVGRRSGFDITSVDLKGEVYRNDLHEILVAAGPPGVLDARVLRARAPMRRTWSRPAFSLARGSAIFPTVLRGCARSELPGRSLTNNHSPAAIQQTSR
jgi:hypothetical protein